MTEEIKIFLIFIIWLFSSYFWGFVSGGISVLSIGMMSFLGISPQMAGITFKLGKIWNSLAWVKNFHAEWLIRKEYLVWLSIAMMIGGWLGSFFIMSIPDWIMYGVSACSMLILVIVAIWKKSGTWARHVIISRERTVVGYFSYFWLSVLGNMFPAGSGIWYYFANTFILKLSTLEWKATGNAVAVFWFIGTAIGIFAQGNYHLIHAIMLAIGMYIGWYFATKHMIKLGDHAMRNIILFGIIIFALYFLYLAYNSWSNF